MAVTRLKRKAKRNRLRARQKQDRVKHLLKMPVIRKLAAVEAAPAAKTKTKATEAPAETAAPAGEA